MSCLGVFLTPLDKSGAPEGVGTRAWALCIMDCVSTWAALAGSHGLTMRGGGLTAGHVQRSNRRVISSSSCTL